MKKTVSNLILIIFILFITTTKVEAKMITIEELVNSLNNSELTKLINENNNENDKQLKIENNNENSTINIYTGEELFISLNYTEDYVEYDNRDFILTEENLSENFEKELSTQLYIGTIAESILTLSGYEDKTIEEDYIFDNYDDYGLLLTTEHYDFSNSNENSHYNIKGDYLKYFKMSLDTDKIDALVEEYGTDISDEDEKKPNSEEEEIITTRETNINNNNSNEIDSSPGTGQLFNIFSISILALFSLFSIFYLYINNNYS